MGKPAYLSAIAGLLHDPALEGSKAWIPAGWETDPEEKLGLASRLAAGQTEKRAAASKGQLRSALNSIIADGESSSKAAYWPLAPLGLEKTSPFPDAPLQPGAADAQRSDLLKALAGKAAELKAAFENAPDASLPQFIESLALLLQQYAWCVPSAYAPLLEDASLYDHSRMTAALAAIIAEAEISPGLVKNPSTSDQEAALLVAGDISGIQDFIYQISSRGATGSLRGRSFYLQMLGEVVPRFILQQLGLPITNLIYAGGGHFYLLARPDQKQELKDLSARISRVLLYHHRGDLYLALDSLPLAGKDFFGSGIADKWAILQGNLQKVKAQRFAELGTDLNRLFEPQGHGGNEDRQCQVCGLEHPLTKVDQRDPSDEGVRKCPLCRSFEELGDSLRRADWLVLEQIPAAQPPDMASEWIAGDWRRVFSHFGFDVRVSQSAPDVTRPATVLALHDDQKLPKPPAGAAVGRGFLVNVTPVQADRIKPFDVLEAESKGIPRLGVLRMDVDNMGDMFTKGLGKKASLARLASLSFAVHLFFDGWVGYAAEKRNREGEHGQRLYSIYSGGDDLFFVGSWDEVIELAIMIRADLGRYTGNHPGVHASAGVVLVGGKYPLSQAAQDAGRAEEQAKDNNWSSADGRQHRKDSVTFLGQTIAWQEFGLQDCEDISQQNIHFLFHRLEKGMESGDIPKALLGLLIDLQGQHDFELDKRRRQGTDLNQQGQVQALYGRWNWLSVYYIRRMQKRLHDAALKDVLLKEILDLLEENKFMAIRWIGLAARWAELSSR